MTLILRGRRFGFSLEDIRQWLQIYDRQGSREQYQVWLDMAERQLSVLDTQIGELQAARTDLEELRVATANELAKMT